MTKRIYFVCRCPELCFVHFFEYLFWIWQIEPLHIPDGFVEFAQHERYRKFYYIKSLSSKRFLAWLICAFELVRSILVVLPKLYSVFLKVVEKFERRFSDGLSKLYELFITVVEVGRAVEKFMRGKKKSFQRGTGERGGSPPPSKNSYTPIIIIGFVFGKSSFTLAVVGYYNKDPPLRWGRGCLFLSPVPVKGGER